MKKIITIALAIAVAASLAGCGDGIEDVAAAKAQCHELGGTFTSWKVDNLYGYNWECDLSDPGVKK